MSQTKRTEQEREPSPEESAAAFKFMLVGIGLSLVLLLFLDHVLDAESKGTALWHYGRVGLVVLLGWTGRVIGFGKGRAVAENVECLAIAVVMALILKHFLIEAYKIPTGSMQPTILGNDERHTDTSIILPRRILAVSCFENWSVIVVKFLF